MSVTSESVRGPGPAPGRPPLVEPTYEGDFVLEQHLMLESGRALASPTLHYAVYGKLNAARDNAVLICHALSGSARVGDWWPEVFGPGAVLSLEHDFVICINLLGPATDRPGRGSVDPETGLVYGPRFPPGFDSGTMSGRKGELLDSLGIRRLRLILGGSIGGMQALEWAVNNPDRVERAAIIGVVPLSAMGLALNHIQRLAIQNDPNWDGGYYLPQRPPSHGLSLARQVGMLSYKSAELFHERFSRNPNRNGEDPWSLDNQGGGLIGGRFDIAGYLDYQGERFIERFDANSYLAIMRTMDTWDPLNGYSSAVEVFSKIRAKLILIGISSDWLFPAESVRDFAETIRAAGVQAEYREMKSSHGHDAFLAEQSELLRLLQ